MRDNRQKAAPLLRHVMDRLYNDDMAGLCGNEDVGQMSAWFVLSSMGIYRVEPAGGKFVFELLCSIRHLSMSAMAVLSK